MSKRTKEEKEKILSLLSSDKKDDNMPTPEGVEIVIYHHPLDDQGFSDESHRILRIPNHYHLIDCLKALKFGRPANNQDFLDICIGYLGNNIEDGVPFY
jgi:hypothetical protein